MRLAASGSATRVSVIVPVHNRVDLLPQTLASVAEQTLGAFECIVVDDRTSEDLRAAVPDDERFRIVKLPTGRQGAPAARNFGVQQSVGDYVVFLDSDDLLEASALELRVHDLDQHSQADAIVTYCRLFREQPRDTSVAWNKLWTDEPDDLRRFLRRDIVWQTTSPTWRREALKRIGGWDEDCQSGQDWEFHIRALLAGLRIRKVNSVDHHWRMPGAQPSIGKSAWKNAEHAKAWAEQVRRTTLAVESARGPAQYRRELSALWFEAARRLSETVGRNAARKLLREADRRHLLSLGEVTAGTTYFFTEEWPFVQRRAKQHLLNAGREDFFTLPNGTFNRYRIGTPRVSVVIPVYNAERYLEQAIESVSRQSFREIEIIAINDGSSDRSGDILERLQHGDCRLRVVHQDNAGIVDALNRGIAMSRGRYIARMDGDDVCLPGRFDKQVALLDARPGVVCVGGQCQDIDPLGVPLDYYEFPLNHDEIEEMLLRGHGGVLRHPAVMMRRDAVEHVGMYRKQYEWCEDLDLWLRLAEVGELANLPDVVLQYRQHPKSVVRTKREVQLAVKRQIVADAFIRRQGQMPDNWQLNQWQPDGPNKLLLDWGWRALKQRHRGAARQHALDLIRRQPGSLESWRLLFCALRGR